MILLFFEKKPNKNLDNWKKVITFAHAFREKCWQSGQNAEIAQLVEHNLAKVGVASSSLVFRST